jgi:hypothetical protein
MSESVQIGLGLVALIGVFVLTRFGVAWQVKRASGFILGDLEKQGALGPVTAVELPYTKHDPWRIGMRNYYAKAIEFMVSEGVVGKTGSGKYYLQVEGRRLEAHAPDGHEQTPST